MEKSDIEETVKDIYAKLEQHNPINTYSFLEIIWACIKAISFCVIYSLILYFALLCICNAINSLNANSTSSDLIAIGAVCLSILVLFKDLVLYDSDEKKYNYYYEFEEISLINEITNKLYTSKLYSKIIEVYSVTVVDIKGRIYLKIEYSYSLNIIFEKINDGFLKIVNNIKKRCSCFVSKLKK